MNTLYYNLTGTQITQKPYVTITEKIKVSKGITVVTFSLKELTVHGYGAVNITVDFGDNTPKYIRDFKFEEGYDILEEDIVHKYIPDERYDNTLFYPVISITFLNNYSTFTLLDIEIPIRISRPSFYSEHKNLTVSSIQFVDETDDPMFATFQTANGDILNLKIK